MTAGSRPTDGNASDLSLPPAYRARRLEGRAAALRAAAAAGEAGEEEGLVLWADRGDRLDAALLLKPDRSRRETLPVIYAASLAFADALGAFAPPPAPISFRWPAAIEIDGALAGGLALALAPSPPDAVPAWGALGLDLDLAGGPKEPGDRIHRTTILEEGFEDFTVPALLEGFARHFLVWLNRWEGEGLAPVAREWARRCFDIAEARESLLPGGKSVALGLDGEGNLRARIDGQERVLSLEDALAGREDG
jgi:BirA family transcriptional regulator, biotin operon repressor / biotin---[acetyl-CoA-carboxylase] ligase